MWLELDVARHLQAAGQHFQLQVALRCTQRNVVLFGPSGAGKSLTLRAIAGLLKPESGHIRLHDQLLFDAASGLNLPPQRRKVGYVFQDYALFPHLTVRQNVAFGLHKGWLNPGRSTHHEQVERWLHALRIDHLAQMYPQQISGGQRQRTALARALAPGPQVLLLDEPFAALDHDLRKHLRQELEAVLDASDIPLLLITHDPQDVDVFGQQVVHLADGRLRG
ncbi:Fe(3+) ions import ATP-binding protein FbpC 2 [compost metagenome]